MEGDVANNVSDIMHSSSGYGQCDFVKNKRKTELLSSGLLRSDKCQFITGVSGQPIGPIIRDQESWIIGP